MDRRIPIIIGAAIMAYVLSRPPRRSAGVTTWLHSELEPGFWEAAEGAIDFVSAKLLNGSTLSSESKFDAQMLEARRRNIEMWAWGYHYARTPAEARAEGIAIGQATASRGVKRYCLDLEGEWSGTGVDPRTDKPYPQTTNPPGNAIILIETAAAANPGLEVWWNGYSYRWSDFDATIGRGGRKDLFSEAVAIAIASTGNNGMAARFAKHPHIFGPAKCCPLVATQRVATDGTQWGEWFTAAGTGDAQLAAPLARSITSFYGAGSRGRRTGSAPKEPSLRELALQWKAL